MADISKIDPKIVNWMYNQGWTALRPIQEKAISPIMKSTSDVVISSATASGKTEAFFFPALSKIRGSHNGVAIVYISPLKALINDIERRIAPICEMLDVKLTSWHGEKSQAKKKELLKKPNGVLLITPESLEALLLNKYQESIRLFENLKFFVIDEFHYFLGAPRGFQLISLITRIQNTIIKTDFTPRVALSATFGSFENIYSFLRPNANNDIDFVTDTASKTKLRLLVKGYENERIKSQIGQNLLEEADRKIASYLFETCRGKSNLVFANSRIRTELFSASLRDRSLKEFVPNEFFPHHGSLSREMREGLEKRFWEGKLPTTGICTMTLELGIDIGQIDEVIQISPTHSVSSLRQRLGRSGRRSGESVLRMLIKEQSLSKSSDLNDMLRMSLIQSIATVKLMVEQNWFEPYDHELMNASGLVHQVIGLTGQLGSVFPADLYKILCVMGPFRRFNVDDFKLLLRHLGRENVLLQMSNGELTLGKKGENISNNYSFYAVFETEKEFRLYAASNFIGTLPINSPLKKDMHLIFGGRYWRIQQVNQDAAKIQVVEANIGKPPAFDGAPIQVHEKIRKMMFNILVSGDASIKVGGQSITFLDEVGQKLFSEAKTNFNLLDLNTESIIDYGENVRIVAWNGDKAAETICALFRKKGIPASQFMGIVTVQANTVAELKKTVGEILEEPIESSAVLAREYENKKRNKYDYLLPETILDSDFGYENFDINAAYSTLKQIAS